MNTAAEKFVFTSARMPVVVGFTSLFLLVGAVGTWSVRTEIAGAVIASGVVQVENNRQVIQHPDGGVVGEILAKDGDLIEAGEVVLRLDDQFLQSEFSIIQSELFEVTARKIRYLAERDDLETMVLPEAIVGSSEASPQLLELLEGQARLFEARRTTLFREMDQLDEQIAQTEHQIRGMEAQANALKVQLELVATEIKDSNTLFSKGLAQASRLSALKREEAGLFGQLGSLDAQGGQLRGQIAALEIQKLKLSVQRRENAISEIRDLQIRELELRERSGSLTETMSRMEIRTPVSGVVFGSQVFAVKSVVSPAAPIMYVVPQDQKLVIVGRLDPVHVDQVKLGQDVTLRFTAFDQRTTPELFGAVERVSADALNDDVSGAPFFEVELLLNEGEVGKLGGQKLLPGMPVEAFIKTADRTPLNYLIKPFLDYFNRALREN